MLRFRPVTARRAFSSSSTARANPLQPYITHLRQRYPSADAPSLIASFLILHELTAVVPLIAGFFSLKALGVGTGLVGWAVAESEGEGQEDSWAKQKVRKWVTDGEAQAERVGRRYGVLGWEKESREEREARKALASAEPAPTSLASPTVNISGDVANLVASYLLVKALISVRIVVSLRLTPPLANVISKRFNGVRAMGKRWMRKREKGP